MSFSNLDTLYNERVSHIYQMPPLGFGQKEPYYFNYLKPGPMSDAIKNDSQALPITATLRDIKRLVNFSVDSKGLLFLAKQQLLQTGNVFAYTSVVNPLFVVGNAVPFLHFNRGLRGTKILTIPDVVKGRLQKETGKVAVSRVNTLGNNPFGKSMRVQAIRGQSGGVGSLLAGILGNVSSVSGTFNPASTVYVEGTRPDINYFDTLTNNPPSNDPMAFPPLLGFKEQIKESISSPNRKLVGKNTNKSITNYSTFISALRSTYATKNGKLSYFNDQAINDILPANMPWRNSGEEYAPESNIYKFENDKADDYVEVSIKVPSKKTTVQFRAFIKDIKQQVKSEYNSQNYIGRTEKYVTFGGVTRTLTFDLTLHSFSQEEMNGMYTKMNFLTGLAFPLGTVTSQPSSNAADKFSVDSNVPRGSLPDLVVTGNRASRLTNPQTLAPPMVALTIGRLYVDQPGYFTDFKFEFGELFDIDKQLPFTVRVRATYIILEKETAFYDTPFYGLFQLNLPKSNVSDLPTPPDLSLADLNFSNDLAGKAVQLPAPDSSGNRTVNPTTIPNSYQFGGSGKINDGSGGGSSF